MQAGSFHMSDNLSQVSGTHQERAHRHAPRETPPPLLNGVYPLFVSSPSSSDTVPSHARPMAAPSRSQLSGSQNVRLHPARWRAARPALGFSPSRAPRAGAFRRRPPPSLLAPSISHHRRVVCPPRALPQAATRCVSPQTGLAPLVSARRDAERARLTRRARRTAPPPPTRRCPPRGLGR